MANDCCFDVKIKGPEDKVHKLEDWLSASYNYNEGQTSCTIRRYLGNGEHIDEPCEHHIGYRIFDFSLCDEGNCDDGSYLLYGFGTCAWSCKTCMFGGPGTYYGDIENKKQERYSITLPDACKELGVAIEIYSDEPGVGFAEHYYINNQGEVIIDECSDLDELFFDYQGDSYQDAYCALLEEEDPETVASLLPSKEDYEAGFIGSFYKCDFYGEHYVDSEGRDLEWTINEGITRL